ncbi:MULTISPECIES: SAF domain-containing protein [unclassified Corynebacterium]|uniref:SAF domain-containing protein n=1 Tax=unclassified Corynebacterium TaxID=2624378 RepID=UPI0029CA6E35|nr:MULTISPECIES: SAF domain-containing protein [unclassified Corynebacterium]WPF66781.1 SAF domain-containing protein [Corynebacterium sp. 22KM0430]WPF69269.1 SAF domain-containing protein [Corynebacterium sp. 21KM1197]
MFSRLLVILRTPGWRRTALLRRSAAACLFLLALVLALKPQGTPALFFRAEVGTGQEIAAEHVEIRRVPAAVLPATALRDAEEALGKVLIAPAVPGEPVTPSRLLTPTSLAGKVAVPVPLSAPEIMHHGDVVSVVARGENDLPDVIAEQATVLLPPGPDNPTVLLSLPEKDAARVASAALSTPLTVFFTRVGYSTVD